MRRRVTDFTRSSSNWHKFIGYISNKMVLLQFLADKKTDIETTNTIVVTKK